MSETLDERLRAIVVSHTVVGGYPDTMGIARAAYELGRTWSEAPASAMSMERTVWHGSVKKEETQSMDAWIPRASVADLDRLTRDDLVVTDADHQTFLAGIWSDCAFCAGQRVAFDEDNQTVTYHWQEGERIALRRALKTLRPEHLAPEPGQGSLL